MNASGAERPARSGQCLCGAVKITVRGDVIGVRVCWCRDCQYLASGNATVNAIFDVAGVSIEGELTDYVSIADSGNVMHRRFCPRCGTPLLSASEARPDRIVVRVGAMNDRNEFTPGSIIWTNSAPSWSSPDPAIPQTPAQPPPVG